MRLGKCPGSRGRVLFCLFQPPGGSDCCSENVGYLNSAYLGTLLSRSYGLMDSCYSEEQHPPPPQWHPIGIQGEIWGLPPRCCLGHTSFMLSNFPTGCGVCPASDQVLAPCPLTVVQLLPSVRPRQPLFKRNGENIAEEMPS